MGMSYSFADVTGTLVGPGGVVDLGSGSAVGEEGIKISMSGDGSSMTVGVDGCGMHNLNADKSGTVTIDLLKTSPVNAKLQTMFNLQSRSDSLWGKNIISITNTVSGDKTICSSCAFGKKPDVTYKKEGGTVTWTFNALFIDTILGTY